VFSIAVRLCHRLLGRKNEFSFSPRRLPVVITGKFASGQTESIENLK
jgi:hypothetical protein